MADAARAAAHEEHPAADAGGREHTGVVTGSGDELGDREAAPLELFAQHRLHVVVHVRGLGEERRLEADRRDEPVEALPVGCARIDADDHASRDHVRRARHDLELSHRCDRCGIAIAASRTRSTSSAAAHERVAATVHRRRAGVSCGAFDDDLAARDADDAGDDAEGHRRALEHGPLLDVHLEVELGQRPALHAREAAAEAALLVPERDDGERAGAPADALDRLEPGEHAEDAVEATAVRHRVEVRADPDLAGVGVVPRSRPSRFPSGSTSTVSPASRIQPATRSCASCSPALPPTRFAPGPAPIA